MSVFEGARRFSYAVVAVCTVIVIGFQATSDPHTDATYVVPLPGTMPVKLDEDCPSDGASRYFSKALPSGSSVGITLCLLSESFDAERLIPYKIDDKNMLWGAAAYSDEVTAYLDRLEKNFEIPAADMQLIEDTASRLYWQSWLDTLKSYSIYLVGFFATTWVTGWIVRGFMGIPRGMDRKPDSDS